MSEKHVRAITLADDDWMRAGENDDHLTAILVINGRFHHLEAIRVIDDDDGVQCSASIEFEEWLDAVYQLGGEGPFDTVTIRGNEYVVIATPFQ